MRNNVATLQDQPAHLLRRAYQKGVAIFLEKTSDYNVTPLQFSVLTALEELGDSTQRRISQYIAMEPSNVHPMLKRMKSNQLIAINSDPHDKRRSVISMTKTGKRMLEQIRPLDRATSKSILAGLDDDEQKTFMSLLEKVSGEA